MKKNLNIFRISKQIKVYFALEWIISKTLIKKVYNQKFIWFYYDPNYSFIIFNFYFLMENKTI
jgi:hypothetical protein